MAEFATQSDTVTVHYRASTRDGGVIEDTTHRKPLVLKLDDERYLAAFRANIVGMQTGQSKAIHLEPEDGFGLRDHRRQFVVPDSCLPAGIRQGDQLTVAIDEADVNVWLVNLKDNEATLDTNHPLSGETLELEVQLVAIDRGE